MLTLFSFNLSFSGQGSPLVIYKLNYFLFYYLTGVQLEQIQTSRFEKVRRSIFVLLPLFCSNALFCLAAPVSDWPGAKMLTQAVAY